jgi:hypothetical protein
MKRIIGKATLVLLVAGLFSGLTATGASAMSISHSGCIGAMTTGLTGGEYRDLTGLGATDWLVSPAMTIQRAASSCWSGNQVISVTMRIFGYTTGDGWKLRQTATLQGPISVPAGYQVQFKKVAWDVSYLNESVDIIVKWARPDGSLIGSERLDYNAVGDYVAYDNGERIYSSTAVGAFIHWNQ